MYNCVLRTKMTLLEQLKANTELAQESMTITQEDAKNLIRDLQQQMLEIIQEDQLLINE